MQSLIIPTDPAQDYFPTIVESIVKQGYVVLNQVFDVDYLTRLLKQLKALDSREFNRAGIGREDTFQKNVFVRSDEIHWLSGEENFLTRYNQWVEALRLYVNRHLFLGLYEYESMFAHYPVGAFYKKHLDAFKAGINRRLSTVLYLNPQWGPQDGGQLVMYDKESDQVLCEVLPVFGRMILFLSEEFPHEVLPASRSRYSLTGWYRVNEGFNPAR
ncbi:2OG-Fe(II) oxygenase [Marinicella gelatinilytica]|uniref:2OG-Fe(II) oxygenase n=1 Tax=Marinicella gelatinilytica TaxID=2996017 RepID=UPI002260F3BB|nr:2OG-Fe(II) oxygenase [Marinicella gelatinilytica]MCX7545582.1 2OG-Fe(II) oxygenase [Marinicella gelatinilytica]